MFNVPKAITGFTEKFKKLFQAKVSTVPTSSGCLLWLASKTRGGYGQMCLGEGNQFRAHRLAYWLANGDFAWDFEVCHKCDSPACVNPDHLFLATHEENMRDMCKKSRLVSPAGDRHGLRKNPCKARHGSRHYCARITESQVREIRQLAASGILHSELARQFGISHSNIAACVTRKTWKHVR